MMNIDEIQAELETRNISHVAFWQHVAGGDMHPMPRVVFERCCSELAGTGREELLERLKDAGDDELYREVELNGSHYLELTERGAELCRSAGLTVSSDDYGCAYCVEQATE